MTKQENGKNDNNDAKIQGNQENCKNDENGENKGK